MANKKEFFLDEGGYVLQKENFNLSIFEAGLITDLTKGERSEKNRIDFDCVEYWFGLLTAGRGKKV